MALAADQDDQRRRPDEIEYAEQAEERAIAQRVGERADEQGESEPAGPGRHAGKAADRTDLARIEEIGGERIDQYRDGLVGETAKAKAYYDQAVRWVGQNQETIRSQPTWSKELAEFRAEAERILNERLYDVEDDTE